MFDTQRVEIEWGGRKLSLETGRMARQADAAVFAQYGETSVLATVVAEKSARPGIDFFPLTVNYQEKTYAAGKIPGGFFKREGRPEREGDADLAPDRPADPAAVRRGLQATRRRSSSRCSRTTWRTTPTSSPWSRPRPR